MSGLRWTQEQYDEFLRRGRALPTLAHVEPVRARQPPQESKLERRFVQQLTDAGITGWQRNYLFLPDRDFELDFAWSQRKVAVEVQGMAHRIKRQFKADIEKKALAMLAGWRVLEVDGAAIRDGRALKWTQQLLGMA